MQAKRETLGRGARSEQGGSRGRQEGFQALGLVHRGTGRAGKELLHFLLLEKQSGGNTRCKNLMCHAFHIEEIILAQNRWSKKMFPWLRQTANEISCAPTALRTRALTDAAVGANIARRAVARPRGALTPGPVLALARPLAAGPVPARRALCTTTETFAPPPGRARAKPRRYKKCTARGCAGTAAAPVQQGTKLTQESTSEQPWGSRGQPHRYPTKHGAGRSGLTQLAGRPVVARGADAGAGDGVAVLGGSRALAALAAALPEGAGRAGCEREDSKATQAQLLPHLLREARAFLFSVFKAMI